MIGGIVVASAIPVLVGLGSYGFVKGIKRICKEINLSSEKVNEEWEEERM